MVLSAIAQKPGNLKSAKLYDKAKELQRQRKYDDAIVNYQKSIKKNPYFPKSYLSLAGLLDWLGLKDSAYSYRKIYFDVIPRENIPKHIKISLAWQFWSHGEYMLAEEAFSTVEAPYSSKDSLLMNSVNLSIKSLANPVNIKVTKMPATINSHALQYFPVLTMNEKMMIYTKRAGTGLQDDEDIYYSLYSDSVWTTGRSISKNINTPLNEGACTISADGRILIFSGCNNQKGFGSCDLFISTLENNEWTLPQNMGSVINSSAWDSQPTISADGNTLYFSSNRRGSLGKRDIWVSYNLRGFWRDPKNLGKTINTLEDETTPFIHANGETLFFSSTGHPGLGGADLYLSEYKDSTWSVVKNLGYPINDFNDQSAFYVTSVGNRAYLTYENGTSAIYSCEIGDTLVSNSARFLTGTIKDRFTNEPLAASFSIVDLDSQEKLYHTTSNLYNGEYLIVLKSGGEFGVYVMAKGYLIEDFNFDLKYSKPLVFDTLDIYLTPIQKGASVILENIYFEYDSYALLPKSISELEVIISFLKTNDITVEIIGHTDAKGSVAYNQQLSENRAKSVRDYIVDKGIDDKKIKSLGMGSSRLLISEPPTSSKNRRIEFKILD